MVDKANITITSEKNKNIFNVVFVKNSKSNKTKSFCTQHMVDNTNNVNAFHYGVENDFKNAKKYAIEFATEILIDKSVEIFVNQDDNYEWEENDILGKIIIDRRFQIGAKIK